MLSALDRDLLVEEISGWLSTVRSRGVVIGSAACSSYVGLVSPGIWESLKLEPEGLDLDFSCLSLFFLSF